MYSWDGKEADCYRLYVTEKKSLDEVIQFWEERGFTPSKRAFQTQFKRWNFPGKQSPAHKNPELVARVKELWERNVRHKDMLDVLQNEGFQISDRELLRLRLRFGWSLRESSSRPKNKNGGTTASPAASPRKRKRGRGLIAQLGNAILAESTSGDEDESESEESDEAEESTELRNTTSQTLDAELESLNLEELQRRKARVQQMQIESDEKWHRRKRRRRTRGWAGLPADAPGEPPRYPSETTIDESKAYLNLDNKMYRQVREQFLAICQQHDIQKKTIAGPEKWARAKEQLVRESQHLTTIFNLDLEARQQNSQSTPSNLRALSLDVICMDVTKRLRGNSRMGITESKNILDLNPKESRQVRNLLASKLKADHFTSKGEMGPERWNEIKQAWMQESDLLMRALSGGEADPTYADKAKAIEALAKDVMKRVRNENVKADPSLKKQINQGPGPGPAPPKVLPNSTRTIQQHRDRDREASSRNMPPPQPNLRRLPVASEPELQIDPSLLLAASDPSVLAGPSQTSLQQSLPHTRIHTNAFAMPSPFLPNLPMPIYFRLHPHSSTTIPGKTVWLGILQSGTVSEIRNMAMRDHPGTLVIRIEGLVTHKMAGHPDREITVPIEDESELGAYMEHVAGGKATFVVLLGVAQGGQPVGYM
ncbi:hypothetical protein EJ04DRAFT_489758 [Polyplosphaeria fusca]|uniref:Clr5 domain-containing protein n=1 Tax=Polyplosphaeria fusca TaxID=682080 RepID=A0A9P4R4G4_9PLEO|nr:hypothetical protein EJ04DRAFT_489758 [Polyplosphaeria fusca]